MTYSVSSGMLNRTMPYHTCRLKCVLVRCWPGWLSGTQYWRPCLSGHICLWNGVL